MGWQYGLVAMLLVATSLQAAEPTAASHPEPSFATAFSVEGRFAVKHNGKGEYGHFVWQHSPDSDHIAFRTPLGQTVAELHRLPGLVQLITQEPALYEAASAEELTQQRLGWTLPLSGLPYWATGRSASQPALIPRKDTAGNAVSLSEAGWDMEWDNYIPANRTVWLPGKLVLTRPGLEIRLVFQQWQLPEPPPIMTPLAPISP